MTGLFSSPDHAVVRMRAAQFDQLNRSGSCAVIQSHNGWKLK